ncbi:uncharacterized protein LOC132255475 [Phlebotomus argentipes]|uniref:uncharacterized protein LOC132255475 n=1 Tax=Phlebotomus argentipes TaxID=94469 RepID=UPI00289322B9|nr:uncharacterized protein LOC132255475 [Phlebotomus argentipes]
MEEGSHCEGVCCPGTPVSICPTVHSLDTVRALHQTVVSLRTALDDARREIDKLKKQIHVQSDIEQGKIFRASRPESPQETPKNEAKAAKSPKERDKTPRITIDPIVSVTAEPSGEALEGKIRGMASKIDVKIKVSSNIQVDSSSSSEQNTQRTSQEEEEEAHKPETAETDEGETQTIKAEGKSLKINVTSEENLTLVKSGDEINITQNSNENLHLDIDDNSSDGDNSVFTEGAITPAEAPTQEDAEDGQEKQKKDSEQKEQEEVDDIELIFSSDDNKDLLQEDLVSISDYEPWQAPGSSGTPVLVNFCSLGSEEQPPDVPDISRREIKSCSSVLEKQNTDTSEPDRFFSSLEKEDDMRREESFDTFDNAPTFGRKWTNANVLIETDISKCGIAEEGIMDKGRRNTCPNPPAYRPMAHREALLHSRYSRCPFGVKFSRSAARSQHGTQYRTPRPIQAGPKRSSSAQTDISALPEQWQSETHLAAGLCEGLYTLPSKFSARPGTSAGRCPLRPSEKTQEARRVLLSDIHFTSMVPELSRSADHLCHEGEAKGERKENASNLSPGYHKGPFLRTPDYTTRGITPSASLNSAAASQWTVNETSFGTQTPITGTFWGATRGESFDSTRSYSAMGRHHRSRSVPSVRCAICRQARPLRPSESMHYTPRVSMEPCRGVQGSLPDLRHECMCPARRYHAHSFTRSHGDSSGSTDSLLDEAEDFLRRSVDGIIRHEPMHPLPEVKAVNRRCSENDIPRDFAPSKQSLPFLPRTPKCLKPGHLAKVIIKNGRVVIGRIRYVGPVASMDSYIDPGEENTFVGLQLATTYGDCDGTIDGKKFFDCEPLHGVFVPFKKVVMAWSA